MRPIGRHAEIFGITIRPGTFEAMRIRNADKIRFSDLGGFRVIFRSNMVPRIHREDSEPVLEVLAIGTANPNGDYVQHEAVVPHKAHSAVVDPVTVVIRRESSPSVADGATDTSGVAGLNAVASTPEEITSATRARLRAKDGRLFRILAFVEDHRLTTLTFAVGSLLLLLAGLLAAR